MSLTHKFMDIVLPLLTLILLPIFLIPILLFKLISYMKNSVRVENLTKKVVIITGSASGIGEQLAYEYAKKGAVLSLVDIRDDNLEAVGNKTRCLGSPEVITIKADVSKVEDCKRFIDETVDHFGKLDHLVNNAGTGAKPTKVENWSDISVQYPTMEVNFWGAVYGTLFAIPHLKKSKGKIVVIASACGWYPLPRISIYNASKAAVINFFETLRTELGWAVGVTIVTPGFIKTDLTRRALASSQGARFGIFRMESAEECAKAIVKGVCKGNMYVTFPSWVTLGFYLRAIIPQLVDSVHRLLFRIPTKKQS